MTDCSHVAASAAAAAPLPSSGLGGINAMHPDASLWRSKGAALSG